MVRVVLALTLILLGCAPSAWSGDRAGWAFRVDKDGQCAWAGAWSPEGSASLRVPILGGARLLALGRLKETRPGLVDPGMVSEVAVAQVAVVTALRVGAN